LALKLNELFDRVWDYLVPEDGTVRGKEQEKDDILIAVEQARAEWLAAKTYFDNVTDPDLVDHAIYSIEASERKYMYLLKRAGALGYAISPSPPQQAQADDPELQGALAQAHVQQSQDDDPQLHRALADAHAEQSAT